MCGGSSAKTDRKETLSAYGDLNSVIAKLSGTGDKLTSSGTSDTGAAAKYYKDIVSGDPTKIMAAAAPEVNTIKSGAEQQKKQISTFGNRTGGTNATTQDMQSKVRGQIADVISKQRPVAAGALADIGGRETSTGVGATEGAGTAASNLASISASSRKTSQQIHDEAVNNWIDAASQILFA